VGGVLLHALRGCQGPGGCAGPASSAPPSSAASQRVFPYFFPTAAPLTPPRAHAHPGGWGVRRLVSAGPLGRARALVLGPQGLGDATNHQARPAPRGSTVPGRLQPRRPWTRREPRLSALPDGPQGLPKPQAPAGDAQAGGAPAAAAARRVGDVPPGEVHFGRQLRNHRGTPRAPRSHTRPAARFGARCCPARGARRRAPRRGAAARAAAELTSRGAADRRRTAGGWAGRRCLTVSCSRRTGSGPRSAGRRGRLQSRLARSRRTAASRARGAEAGGGAGRSWSRRGPAGREAGRPAGTRSPSRTSPKRRAAAPRRARVWARSRARRAATGAGAALGGA